MIARGNTCLRAQSAQHDYESNCMRFDDTTIIYSVDNRNIHVALNQPFAKSSPAISYYLSESRNLLQNYKGER